MIGNVILLIPTISRKAIVQIIKKNNGPNDNTNVEYNSKPAFSTIISVILLLFRNYNKL